MTLVKNITLFLIMILLVACSGNQPPDTNEPVVAVESKPKAEYPVYKSVIEMLQSAGDYKEDQGNLKIVSA